MTVRRTAHVGVLAALAYAALKAAWGAGSAVGVTDVAAFERFTASFGEFEWLATWGTTFLALVAAAILLALVEPWGARLPRLPLRLLAWGGAAVLAIPGFGGVAESLLTYAGLLDGHDNGLAEWVFLGTYESFAVLAVAFVVAAHPRRLPSSASPSFSPECPRPFERRTTANESATGGCPKDSSPSSDSWKSAAQHCCSPAPRSKAPGRPPQAQRVPDRHGDACSRLLTSEPQSS